MSDYEHQILTALNLAKTRRFIDSQLTLGQHKFDLLFVNKKGETYHAPQITAGSEDAAIARGILIGGNPHEINWDDFEVDSEPVGPSRAKSVLGRIGWLDGAAFQKKFRKVADETDSVFRAGDKVEIIAGNLRGQPGEIVSGSCKYGEFWVRLTDRGTYQTLVKQGDLQLISANYAETKSFKPGDKVRFVNNVGQKVFGIVQNHTENTAGSWVVVDFIVDDCERQSILKLSDCELVSRETPVTTSQTFSVGDNVVVTKGYFKGRAGKVAHITGSSLTISNKVTYDIVVNSAHCELAKPAPLALCAAGN